MDEQKRPSIPAELKRRVLIEAGHRCAIPTCRFIEVDAHHIIPWAKCKKHEYENLIALCPNCHRRVRKGDIDRKSLRIYKANLRFAMDKYSQFEMDILYELLNATPIEGSPFRGIPFPKYLYLLVKRLIDSKFIDLVTFGNGVYYGSIKINPDYISITEKGRQFLKSLSDSEIGS